MDSFEKTCLVHKGYKFLTVSSIENGVFMLVDVPKQQKSPGVYFDIYQGIMENTKHVTAGKLS